MFLLLDTANLDTIRAGLELFPLAGITTCPTILVKEKRPPVALLKEIRALIGEERMLHAQVMGTTREEICEDARFLRKQIGGNFFVKIPVTPEGFKAMAVLHKEGIPFTATTIHSVSQAMLAAGHGASFLAPYVNRIDNLGVSGADVVREIAEFLARTGSPAKILAASFRNVRQITDVLRAGAHTVTLAPDLAWKMTEHPMTDLSVAKFREAWDGAFGPGHNVSDLQ